MNNHQDLYKQVPMGFTDASNSRVVRAERHEERRKVHRAQNFARHRDVERDLVLQDARSTRRSDPAMRLRRWKEQKALKKKIEQQKKKPVFKVGIVHHNFYSPTAKDRINSKLVPCHTRGALKVKHNPTPPKRITRATQKRLDAKKLAGSVTPGAASTSKSAASTSKSVASTSKSVASTSKFVSSSIKNSHKKRVPLAKRDISQSFAPNNYTFKPPMGIGEIPLFGRVAISRKSSTFQISTTRTSAANESNPIIATEQPWPTNSSEDPSDPQSSRNPLIRQSAIDRFSQDSSTQVSTRNSSIESCRLRLSSEDESAEETNVENHSSDKFPENIDMNIITESMIPDESTPPRSGTPPPASYSPFITATRGKDSARKEQRTKLGMRRSSVNEIPTKDTVMKNLNISVDEEAQTAQYFKFILQRETDNLLELCAKWEAIKSEPNISEDAGYQINAAIGHTNLLIKKKFSRFQNLVQDCETGKGEMLVTCKDLGGFWEMMNREIKDCEGRFANLEILRSRDWIEEEFVSKIVMRKKAAPPKVKINNAKSSARLWIAAARKKKMSQAEDLDDDIVIAGQQTVVEEVSSTSGSTQTPKKIDRSKTAPTPKKTPTSLLKHVQLSQASRNIRSPLAVMKISQMCKTPEVKLDDTISYVNSDQTPAKSILKKSEDSSGDSSILTKSSRKVDFNDEVFLEEAAEVDEALQNSIDLGKALERIESYESDYVEEPFHNITTRRLEKKKLDFENDSLIETENTDTGESATIAAIPEPPSAPIAPQIHVIPSTPLKEKMSPVKNKRRSSRRTSTIVEDKDENEETNVNTRVLRNRMINVETPNKSVRRSTRSNAPDTSTSLINTNLKENDDPSKEANKVFVSPKACRAGDNNETKRRRSSRKSVRFNPDDCSACGEAAKPVLPMTPHSRRSRKISLLGETPRHSLGPAPTGDLISFDTPAEIPARIRRSSNKK